MSKTILITGVAGLLGSRLADWIIENHPEHKVLGIDDLSGGYKENINPKVEMYYVNLVKHSFVLSTIFNNGLSTISGAYGSLVADVGNSAHQSDLLQQSLNYIEIM